MVAALLWLLIWCAAWRIKSLAKGRAAHLELDGRGGLGGLRDLVARGWVGREGPHYTAPRTTRHTTLRIVSEDRVYRIRQGKKAGDVARGSVGKTAPVLTGVVDSLAEGD